MWFNEYKEPFQEGHTRGYIFDLIYSKLASSSKRCLKLYIFCIFCRHFTYNKENAIYSFQIGFAKWFAKNTICIYIPSSCWNLQKEFFVCSYFVPHIYFLFMWYAQSTQKNSLSLRVNTITTFHLFCCVGYTFCVFCTINTLLSLHTWRI